MAAKGAAGPGPANKADGKRKRTEDDAREEPKDGAIMPAPRLRNVPPNFTLFKYEGPITRLFIKTAEGAWCRICEAGPFQLGNGSHQNLATHLSGKEHAKVRCGPCRTEWDARPLPPTATGQ